MTDHPKPASMLDAMSRMGESFAHVSSDLEASIQATLGMILGSTSATHVVLLKNTPAGLATVACPGPDAPEPADLTAAASRGIVAEVRRSGMPVFARDMERDTRFGEDDLLVRGVALRSVVCVPVSKEGELLGVLYVGSAPGNTPLGESDVKMLTGIAGLIADFMARSRQYAEIHRLAMIDPLTGLMNRSQMDSVLAIEAERSSRYRFPTSFVMMDLDRFKRVNDTHGHSRGDAVLRAFADIIKSGTRRVDHMFRYGGEEFLVILPHIPKENAKIYAERIRRTTGESLHASAGLTGPCTVSIGIAAMPADGATVEETLEAADRALYRAKAEGRDRVVLA